MRKALIYPAALFFLLLVVSAAADVTADIEKLAENFSLEFRNNNTNPGIIPYPYFQCG